MTATILLIVCVIAQILIAAGLGIYLYRRFSRERKEEQRRDSKS
jgi:hypothetical protein